MCSCSYLDQALGTKAARVPQCLYESFCLQQAEQQLQAQTLPSFGKTWTQRRILWLKLISDQYFVNLSPRAHVCSLCKLPLLGDDGVSHLPYTYTYCIIK